jgi:biopolymer transport protein ExbD/biopolymer transport protein TolR
MALSSPSLGRSATGGLGSHRPLAEINVTPLVDVMLVLLIVFMVTAPMLAQGLKVDLPQAKAAQVVNPKDPIVVSVTGDGKVAIGTETMDTSALAEALLKMTDGDTGRVIQIRADRAANYGTIVGVIDELATNGMVHIALISDPAAHADAASARKTLAAQ